MATVLVVEDDRELLEAICTTLELEGIAAILLRARQPIHAILSASPSARLRPASWRTTCTM